MRSSRTRGPRVWRVRIRELTRRQLLREVVASVVVFLVALPFALGVALASGVPLELGLASAVIGGLLVGGLAGCRLQVTGPAAGLIVLVWDIVDTWGLAALGLAVTVSGALQLVAGGLRLGRWFQAVPPALVLGLLGGIGGLVALGQAHVAIGTTPPGGGLQDLLALPAALLDASANASGASSLGLAAFTLLALVVWERARPRRLRSVPGALVAVTAAALAGWALDLPVARVELPASFASSFRLPGLDTLTLLAEGPFWGATLALAAVAAAESLLSASATDQLHDGPRTDYNRELRALGAGNLVCGLLGALPITGVIVRSAANVKAGARTRLPSMLHAVWLLALVALAPKLLGLLPVPALAALLVYIGLQLVKPAKVRALITQDRGALWVYGATVLGILTLGLLWGIGLGFAVALVRLLYRFTHLDVEVRHRGRRADLTLRGAATFLALPRLAEALDALDSGREVHIHVGRLTFVDHACHVLLREHEKRLASGGGRLVTEWDDVEALQVDRPLVTRRADRLANRVGARVG